MILLTLHTQVQWDIIPKCIAVRYWFAVSTSSSEHFIIFQVKALIQKRLTSKFVCWTRWWWWLWMMLLSKNGNFVRYEYLVQQKACKIIWRPSNPLCRKCNFCANIMSRIVAATHDCCSNSLLCWHYQARFFAFKTKPNQGTILSSHSLSILHVSPVILFNVASNLLSFTASRKASQERGGLALRDESSATVFLLLLISNNVFRICDKASQVLRNSQPLHQFLPLMSNTKTMLLNKRFCLNVTIKRFPPSI